MNYALLTARRRALPPRPVPTITITQQPSSQDAASGVASFSVAATTNFDGLLSYQWQVSVDDGSTWANVSGATGDSLSLSGLTTASDNGALYRVLVSAEGAETATSDSALLTVGAWDVSTLAFVSSENIDTLVVEQNQNQVLSNPTGVAASADGTRVYVPCSFYGGFIRQIHLATPWDLQSWTNGGSWIGTAFSFSTAFPDYTPYVTGIAFRPDGAAMFLLDATTQAITEHALSTPWDTLETSASYAPTRTFDPLPNVYLNAQGLAFRPDGLRLYVAVVNPVHSIREYRLSSAWNIETATFAHAIDVSNGSSTSYPTDVLFRGDGRRMYATSAGALDGVSEFSLALPWDVSTATFVRRQRFLFGGFTREDDPQGIAIKPDGRRLFVVGWHLDFDNQHRINEYTLG
jgi:sugar lactone lactonase YvrE